MSKKLRIGILGAAKINKNALLDPCKKISDQVVITAIAARDKARCLKYVEKMGLTDCKVYDSYDDLINDENSCDALYNPLPNGSHFEWTIKALNNGKHVLCEKPFASNSREARIMVKTAKENNLILMEAFHWWYHPLRKRIQDLLNAGTIGKVKTMNADFLIPPNNIPRNKNELRYNSELAGGATMDLGTYTINWLREFNNREIPIVTSAEAVTWDDDREIDEGMKATFLFKNNIKAKMECSFIGNEFNVSITINGDKGTLKSLLFQNLVICTDNDGNELIKESVGPKDMRTYDYMVRAFVSHVTQFENGIINEPDVFQNTGEEIINQMSVIDEVYKMANMNVRHGPSKL